LVEKGITVGFIQPRGGQARKEFREEGVVSLGIHLRQVLPQVTGPSAAPAWAGIWISLFCALQEALDSFPIFVHLLSCLEFLKPLQGIPGSFRLTGFPIKLGQVVVGGTGLGVKLDSPFQFASGRTELVTPFKYTA
jgi:hypothetical protein